MKVFDLLNMVELSRVYKTRDTLILNLLCVLEKCGYVERVEGGWTITNTGMKELKGK